MSVSSVELVILLMTVSSRSQLTLLLLQIVTAGNVNWKKNYVSKFISVCVCLTYDLETIETDVDVMYRSDKRSYKLLIVLKIFIDYLTR